MRRCGSVQKNGSGVGDCKDVRKSGTRGGGQWTGGHAHKPQTPTRPHLKSRTCISYTLMSVHCARAGGTCECQPAGCPTEREGAGEGGGCRYQPKLNRGRVGVWRGEVIGESWLVRAWGKAYCMGVRTRACACRKAQGEQSAKTVCKDSVLRPPQPPSYCHPLPPPIFATPIPNYCYSPPHMFLLFRRRHFMLVF